jgi:hypothetical protein
MGEPWFRPKPFGYGAGLPIHWQGWALLASYCVCVMPAVLLAVILKGSPLSLAPVIVVVVLTIALIFISRVKTEGGWRWRS